MKKTNHLQEGFSDLRGKFNKIPESLFTSTYGAIILPIFRKTKICDPNPESGASPYALVLKKHTV